MPELVTVPELSLRNALPVDRVRELLRKRPDLAAMGKKFGGTRLFSPEAAAAIVAAMEEKRQAVAC